MPARTHGHKSARKATKEYTAFLGMRQRCYNPRNRQYKHYGARGIIVCERWRLFAAFFEDMGPSPSPQHSIDRIDNDGDYEPTNCRWAIKTTQVRNRSNTVSFTLNGVNRPLGEWCELHGKSYQLVKERIYKLRWPLHEALTRPSGHGFFSKRTPYTGEPV